VEGSRRKNRDDCTGSKVWINGSHKVGQCTANYNIVIEHKIVNATKKSENKMQQIHFNIIAWN